MKNYFIIFFNIFILLFCNVNAQDLSILKGGDFQYSDSLIVIRSDSIKFIYGVNKTLRLHFYSKDLFYQIEYYKTYSNIPNQFQIYIPSLMKII